ncbi:MAG: DUF2064 domain-containing protein [Kineosporiaceae bacterium]|nr:DUF2064 domain-containing protein [Kineosporiaceae bacterium]
MTRRASTALVLAKAPRAGHSKTRLIPTFGADGAAALAAAALADTLDAVRAAEVTARVLVLDGMVSELPESLSLTGFRVVPQVEGSHGERIIAAFEQVTGPAVLIGMDTPQVTPALLRLDLDAPADAWLGIAEDGGWWALGLRHPRRDARRVLADVPMSTPRTGAATRDRLAQCGLTVVDLPVVRDVDEGADALAVATAAPLTRFGMLVSHLTSAAAEPGTAGR